MRRSFLVLGAVCAVAASPAAPALAQQCTLEYQRADNMWAASGRPDGALGTETLTLQAGETKIFTTDWKYEKQRNDGSNYYGSHVRVVRNAGKRPMTLVFRGKPGTIAAGALAQVLRAEQSDRARGLLQPGVRWQVKADLMEASCPPADKEAAVPPPGGLGARQVSPREIVLTWEQVAGAREYRVYVTPPPAPHLATRPIVLSGSGTRAVVVLPESVPAGTVYRASIETVGANGGVSRRAAFAPVRVQAAATPGGTPNTGTGGSPPGGPGSASSNPATPSFAGQRCPPGQFVTGFDDAGRILCAAAPAASPASSTDAPPTTTGAGGGDALPDSLETALQQALQPAAGQRPLAPARATFTQGGVRITLVPKRYEIAAFAPELSRSAAYASARVPLSALRLHVDSSFDLALGRTVSGPAELRAGPGAHAVVRLTLVQVPSGRQRLGDIAAVEVAPDAIEVRGSSGVMQAFQEIPGATREFYVATTRQLLDAAFRQALSTLTEF